MNNDLISKEDIAREFEFAEKYVIVDDSRFDVNEIKKRIMRIPTVDAEPVRHGRYDAGGDCTVCGYPMPTDDRCDAIFPDEIKYCYNCGAKIDAEVEG